jgi:hypothetical protein
MVISFVVRRLARKRVRLSRLNLSQGREIAQLPENILRFSLKLKGDIVYYLRDQGRFAAFKDEGVLSGPGGQAIFILITNGSEEYWTGSTGLRG